MKRNEPYFLMLEHDEEDRWITKRTLEELDINTPFKFISYTTDLWAWLRENDLPIVILINIKTVPDDVFTVLKTLKQDPELNAIPVIVLGESTPHDLVRKCYSFGASSFIVKPAGQQETTNKIKAFLDYWRNVAEV